MLGNFGKHWHIGRTIYGKRTWRETRRTFYIPCALLVMTQQLLNLKTSLSLIRQIQRCWKNIQVSMN